MESSAKVHEEAVTNVFSAPWKNSDIILVAGDAEFHVHRTILCLHSPVFEAMLNGDFKEAKQEKITLEGKDPSEMAIFLKLLYRSMFIHSPLDGENVSKILALADEYQTEAIIKQCFAETVITSHNALDLILYASKYDQSVYEKCMKVAQKEIRCENLKKNMPKLEPILREEILVGKCGLLEDALVSARDNLITCMDKLFEDQEESKSNTTCCFSHEVKIREIHKAKKCKACLLVYRARFCDIVQKPDTYPSYKSHTLSRLSFTTMIPSGHKTVNTYKNNQLVKLLQDIDDLLSQRSD